MIDWFSCSDNTQLRIVEEGVLDAPVTVILLHSYMLNLQSWDHLARRLSANREQPVRILRYDHRGHGESDGVVKGTATLRRLGQDLAELITTLVPAGPIVLAGHSMGGMTLMSMADQYPDIATERIAGVALIATASSDMASARFGLPATVAAVANRLERLSVTVLATLGVARLGRLANVGRPLAHWLTLGSDVPHEEVSEVIRLAADCRPETMRAMRPTFDEHDCRLALVTFDGVPTVVVVGDRDRLTPVEYAGVITDWLPESRLVVLPDAGHMLLHERPDDLAGVVSELLHDASSLWSQRKLLVHVTPRQ